LEKNNVFLAKVRISGGGRCNVTHACFDPQLLVKNYPRGHKELLGPFHTFQPQHTIEWFEKRGVQLKTERDGRMFPTSDSSSRVISLIKRRIAGLRVVFRWEPGRHQSNGRSALGDGAADRPPVGHPLVRTHPDTGRKALYLGNHASHILGMPEAEGATLLDTLLRHVTQPRFVYTHRWRTRDLVMWDNRCLLHRAVANYDMNAHRRVMHRNVVRGTVPF